MDYPDVDALPPGLEARQGYDLLIRNFPGQDQTGFNVVVHYPTGSPLTAAALSAPRSRSQKRSAAAR